jgi:hypothetical protein
MGEKKVHKGFGKKPEGKRPLVRTRRRCEDNINIYLQEVGWWRGYMDWIDLAQYRERLRAFVNAGMNFLIP